mmetsp:Transcript_23730/g.74698  ORF Transcript_23730/g.74698 Transcript_23730/m.74698 type:complete len:290 (+) Transcript_23730:1244-2113(+)
MLPGVAGDIVRLKDLHRFRNGLDLLRAQLLLLFVGHGFLPALNRHRLQRLFVFRLILDCRSELLLVLRFQFRLRVLTGLGLFDLFIAVLDGVCQVGDHHAVGVLRIHLRLFALIKLGTEIVLESLQSLDNAARLELVCICLRSFVVRVGGLQECHAQGAHLLGQLHEGLLGTSAVVGLFLEHLNCTVQCINTLTEILMLLFILLECFLANFFLFLLLGLVLGNLVFKIANQLASLLDFARKLLNARPQQLDVLPVFLDILFQALRLHLTPRGELSEGDLILFFLFLAFD